MKFSSLLLCVLCWFSHMAAQSPRLIVPTGHTRQILHLEVSPSGGMLASSSIDETVKVWDAVSGRELYTHRPGTVVRDASFSFDGKYLALAAFTEVIILETERWTVAKTIPGWNVFGVRFHPERNELFFITQRQGSTGEDPIQVKSVRPAAGQEKTITQIESQRDRQVSTLDISINGRKLILNQGWSGSSLIDTETGDVEARQKILRFTTDGTLFSVEKDGTNTTFGTQRIDGSQIWSLQTNNAEIKYNSLRHQMAFYAGRFYWLNKDGHIANGDLSTGNPTMARMTDDLHPALTAGPDGKLFVATTDYRIRVYPLPSMTMPGRTFGESVLKPAQLAGHAYPNLISWGSRGALKSLRIDGPQIVGIGQAEGLFSFGRAGYSQDGSLLHTDGIEASSDIFAYQDPTRHAKPQRFRSGFEDTRATSASTDGSRLAVVGKTGYLIMDTANGQSVAKDSLMAGDAYFNDHAALSPRGEFLLLSVARYTGNGQQTRSSARLIDLSSGQVKWQRDGRWDHPSFSLDGSRIYASIFENLAAFSTETGDQIERHALPNGRFPFGISFNDRRDIVACTHNSIAYIYNLKTDQERRLDVPGEDIYFDLCTFMGDDFVVFAGREGVLRIFDLRSMLYVAALVRYADGDDWALLAPDGRFDATPGAMQRMYYLVNNQQYALEQLFEGYYTPGLAEVIFSRLSISDLPPITPTNSLRPAPEVDIQYRPGWQRNLIVEDDTDVEDENVDTRVAEATITVIGSPNGSQLSELRLYRNGKLLPLDASRNLIVEDDVPDLVNDRLSYRVILVPGNNTFRAVALNDQSTESQPAYLSIDYTPSENAPSVGRLIQESPSAGRSGPGEVTLHLITIGIDEYANPELNLNFAKADAAAIDRQLGSRTAKLAGNIKQYTIRDNGATRTNIMVQLQQVVDQADVDDLFVFYFAGHGIVLDRREDEFYLVPHEVTATQEVSAKGLSATVLRKLSAQIEAGRQLFLLDACQSGGALSRQQAIVNGSAEEKAIAGLARTTGTHWLTATDSDQLASEFGALGHGAFTYVLLDALSGSADAMSPMPNGEITIEELKRFLEIKLPEITRQYAAKAQYPSSFSYGPDFILVR